MSKRQKRVLVTLAAVLAIAAAIFAFSAQSGPDSSLLSGGVTRWLLSHLNPLYAQMSAAEQRAWLVRWEPVVRKLAHFTEYMLLGLALTLHLRARRPDRPLRRALLLAWALAALYACTDEVHQCFVDSRGLGDPGPARPKARARHEQRNSMTSHRQDRRGVRMDAPAACL